MWLSFYMRDGLDWFEIARYPFSLPANEYTRGKLVLLKSADW